MVIVTISVPSGTSGSGSATAVGADGLALAGADLAAAAGASAAFSGAFSALGGAAGALPRSAALSPSARMVAIGVLTATSAVPSGDQYLAKGALIGSLDFHRRLVGFDLGDDIARLDRFAFLLQPLGKVALFHGRRQRRHQHLNGHSGSRDLLFCLFRLARSAIDVGP